MKQINYANKPDYGNGPWQNEADSYSWIDDETGFHCVIWRLAYMGHLNGYVGIYNTSPLSTIDCNDLDYIEVHGGLTFSGKMKAKDEGRYLFDEDLWYFGFDCAHANDMMPIYARKSGWLEPGFIYRDFNYVKSEIESLCRQLQNWEKQCLENV